MADAEPVVTKGEPEAEMAPGEDVAIQSYPSPTADGQDNGPFYNASADSEQHHHLDLGQQETNEGQLEQPPTPRQQMRHAISSVEELQLAAQLSQGIAHSMPLMESGEDHNMEHVVVPRHDMDQHEQDPQNHGEQLHHDAMHQDSMHHDHLHQEHMSHDGMSQDHISQEQLSQEEMPQNGLPPEHMPQEHMPQEHMPQEHMPQDHIPQDHMAQDHPMSQDHLPQDHLAQDHMHQGHLHEDMHQGHMHQQHDHLPQQEHEQMAEHEQDLRHGLPQDQQDQQGHPQPQQAEYAHNPQHQVAQPPPQYPSGTQPMGQFHPLYHLPIPDNTPPRKRSKVSRACDECRRKKVKCDAKSETGEHACSNCRRANARCLFSRIPQKRGPSKGYIKELADRINHIEGKLASEGNSHNVDALSELLGQARRESSDVFAQPGEPENGRKRPHSSISGAELGTPASSRQPTWSSEPRPDAGTRVERQRPPFSVDDLAPTPVASRAEPGAPDDFPDPSLAPFLGGRSIDATAYNGYLDVVHPCFPLLPGNKDRMTNLLSQCPAQLRDAFVEAFNAAMQSFPSFTGPYASGDLLMATRLIMDWEANSLPRSYVMNLVRLQTLTLIAITVDNQGPASVTEEYGGPAKESILGFAVGLAYRMRLHVSLAELDVEGGVDLESNECIAQRCWWVLVMLDRWNAISTARPISVLNESVVLLPKLGAMVGDNVFQLARLSAIMSGFSLAAWSAPKSMTGSPVLSYMMHVSMELFRDFISPQCTPQEFPTLHLAYWHCRLLAYLFQMHTKPSDLMWVCKESASILLDHPLLITPLTHHFFCLTTLALLELRKVDSMRDEASLFLKDLLHRSSAPSAWDAVIRDRITVQMKPSAAQGSTEAAASQGTLLHLADIATAAELNAAEAGKEAEPATAPTVDEHGSTSMDAKSLILRGYLNIMAEERPGR